MLNFQHSAIKIQNIDSAVIVFRKVGTNISFKQRFEKHAEGMIVSLASLTSGAWNSEVEVYTMAENLLSNQYKIVKPIFITDEKSDIEISGPGITSGNGWLKRHVKASAGNEVVLIVPDEVYDSYFELRVKNKDRYAIGIQREAININYLVAHKTWTCTNACLDANPIFIDTNLFMPFTQAILSAPWTKSNIDVLVMNNQMAEILSYKRTWVQ